MATIVRTANTVTQRAFGVENSGSWTFAGSNPPATLAEGLGSGSGPAPPSAPTKYLLSGILSDQGSFYSQLIEATGWSKRVPLFCTVSGVSLKVAMRDTFGAGATYFGNTTDTDGQHRAYNTGLSGHTWDSAQAGPPYGIRCPTLSVLSASPTYFTHSSWAVGDITLYLNLASGRLNDNWTHGFMVNLDPTEVGPENAYAYLLTETLTLTFPTQPNAFALLAPATHTMGTSLTPTLSWDTLGSAVSSAKAEHYLVEISVNADLSAPLHSATTTQANLETDTAVSSYRVPAGVLSPLTKYYWRVTALNYAGADNTSQQTRACTADFDFTTGAGSSRRRKIIRRGAISNRRRLRK